MYKLFNFPSVNVITIPENKNRVDCLLESFNFYNVTNIKVNVFKKYEPGDYLIEGEYCNLVTNFSKGVLTGHLIAIKNWYENTNENYTIICEDDLSLESVQYWKFDWSTFFNLLPKNWGCVQLVLIKEGNFQISHCNFRKRNWDDLSVSCYLITRSFAKKIIDFYYLNNTFTLEYKGIDEYKRRMSGIASFIIPIAENIIYSLVEPIYIAPLFLENIKFSTTSGVPVHQGVGHVESHNLVHDWWKNGGLDLNTVKNCSDIFN